MTKTLVLGVGNLLLSDDGLGVHAIRRLESRKDIPPDTQLIDGGTCGLELLQYFEGIDRLIIIDAVRNHAQPGTIHILTGNQIPAYLSMKISPHEVALPELLFAAQIRDLSPSQILVYGIEPASLELGMELTGEVNNHLDALVDQVVQNLG
jgi:hydrogenase maturation protease